MNNTAYRHSNSIGNGNVNSNNVTNIVNANKVTADGDLDITEWLSPLDPNVTHREVTQHRDMTQSQITPSMTMSKRDTPPQSPQFSRY